MLHKILKIIYYLTTFGLLFALTNCGGGSSESPTTANQTTSSLTFGQSSWGEAQWK